MCDLLRVQPRGHNVEFWTQLAPECISRGIEQRVIDWAKQAVAYNGLTYGEGRAQRDGDGSGDTELFRLTLYVDPEVTRFFTPPFLSEMAEQALMDRLTKEQAFAAADAMLQHTRQSAVLVRREDLTKFFKRQIFREWDRDVPRGAYGRQRPPL